jgi:hypothetical protein
MVTHFDRFLLPSIAQVEYRLGAGYHHHAHTPRTPNDDIHTPRYRVGSVRTPILSWLVRPFVKPVGMRVLKQDARMLARQTETIRAFGGEQFASTEIDVLGKHIWRLLRAAERRDPSTPEETSEVQLVV